MIYAPVIIPTINRHAHLKKCLESLSNCKWADMTDVFVAVDYPNADTYWDGYRLVCEYLSNCKGLGFKSFKVIYRKENLFCTSKGNMGTLREDVFKEYDRVIETEDDNVFSPNFLVYMNKGLEKFENDNKVLAINGYKHFYPIKIRDNTFFRQNVDFSAWGCGFWREKYRTMIEPLSTDYFKNKLSFSNFWKVLQNGNNRAINFLQECEKEKVVADDNALSVMMPLENMNVVMPCVSLVRNMGWDDSGVHCPTTDEDLASLHTTQKISSDDNFEFVGSGYEFYNENKRIYVRDSYGKQSWKVLARCVLSYLKNKIKRTY